MVVPPRLAAGLRDSGWTIEVGDDPPADALDAIWRQVPHVPPDEAAVLVNRHVFGRLATAAMLPTLERVCDGWRPDLVLRDPCEYASAIAAERRGIPHAHVAISLAEVESGSLEHARPELERHLEGSTERIRASPYLTRFPASLDPSPFPRTVRCAEAIEEPSAAAARWRRNGDDRPLVYATLGTEAGRLPFAVPAFRTVLDAVRDLPARVLMTIGRDTPPAALGPLPDNVDVEAWVPQADALAHACAVVCHGGSGTTFGTLAAGIPLVILPLFADQPVNARLVAEAGAGLVVEDALTDPAAVAPRLREAIRTVLTEPSYREAAERVAAETAMAATPEHAIDRVARWD